jgi:hypothetical protein
MGDIKAWLPGRNYKPLSTGTPDRDRRNIFRLSLSLSVSRLSNHRHRRICIHGVSNEGELALDFLVTGMPAMTSVHSPTDDPNDINIK